MSTRKFGRTALIAVLALSIIMSITGGTIAWFTDEVTSANNVITAGNLDVELYYQVKDSTEWTEVKADTNVFMQNSLWEPGHTEVVKLKVVNKGNLALKYELGVNVASETPSVNVKGDAFNLSDYIKAGVVEGNQDYDRDQAVVAVDATAFTLKSGYVSTATTLLPKTADNSDNEDIVTMVVYMPTTVGNEANHAKDAAVPQIKLGVKLTATQATVESDSFGTDYDKYALLPAEPWDGEEKKEPTADANGVIHVTSAAELVAMMDVTGNSIYSGKTIVLDTDIDLNGNTVKGIGSDSTNFAGIFDGQGHIISNFKIDASDRTIYAGLFNQVSHGGTVKNLIVKNATVVGNSMVGAVASSVDSSAVVDNCKAIDCTLIGVKKVGAVVGYSAGSTVTNNYAEKCKVYYSEKEGGEVLGFENTGSTVSNNTFNDVTVEQAQFINLTEDMTTRQDFDSPNTIINLAGNTLTLTGSDQEVSGNLTVTGGTVDNSKGFFDVRPNDTTSKIVYENVDFTSNVKKKTYGNSTNWSVSAVEVCAPTQGNVIDIVFRNCNFKNSNVVFEGMSGKDFTVNALFEGCTFENRITNSEAIDISNYVTANITIKNCSFDMTVTSNVNVLDALSSSNVTVKFEGNNTVNGIAAIPTDSSLAETENEVRVYSTTSLKVTSSGIDTVNGLDTVTVSGIATK